MENTKIIKYIGLYQMILGFLGVVFANYISQNTIFGISLYPLILLSLFTFTLGMGEFIASFSLLDNWLIVFLDLLKRVLFFIVSIIAFFVTDINTISLGFILIESLILIYPIYAALDYIFITKNDDDDDAYASNKDSLKIARTNTGKNLMDLSIENPVLLVFIRHFGCTFCRETVSEVATIENKIKEKGLTPVFVHLSDPSFGDSFFEKFFDHQVHHVSDPARRLYRALKIKRGNLWQLYGLPTWYRGVIAGFFKGHGGVSELEGDEMQLGAYFVLDKGQIVFSHHNNNASEKFNLENIRY